MLTRNVLRVGVVMLGCAVLVLVTSGCASTQGAGRTATSAIPYSVNKCLTPGFSLSEDQALSEKDRAAYEAERHNDVYPAHQGTNGTYVKTSAEDGKIWHWGL